MVQVLPIVGKYRAHALPRHSVMSYFTLVVCTCSCATGVTMSFEGTDMSTAAFSTAGQVKKLNSFSLVSLYFKAKDQFFNVVSQQGPTVGKFGSKGCR